MTRPYEPPDLSWYCTPCDERHEFGDICWYWDVDPEEAETQSPDPKAQSAQTGGTTDGPARAGSGT